LHYKSGCLVTSSCYHHKSGAKVANNPVPTKCFEENFDASKNILLRVLENDELMAQYTIWALTASSVTRFAIAGMMPFLMNCSTQRA
jgi:hypothetical protein